MQKFKAPLICPKGSRVYVTQGYKPDIHDAVDLVVWKDGLSPEMNKEFTHGAQEVSPFKVAECMQSEYFEKTVGMQGQEAPSGGWVDIKGYYDETYDMTLHFQHNCINKIKVGDIVKEGQIIGYMGNAGLCTPAPTADYPFDGTHLHLSVWLRSRQPNANAFSVNPFDYFDFTKWYEGEDSSKEIDNERRVWGLNKKGFKDNWEKIVYLIKRWYIGKW